MQDDDLQSSSQEDEVKRAAELREWLETKISELESESAKLREMLHVVDSVLRKTSFVPATELRSVQPVAPKSVRIAPQVEGESQPRTPAVVNPAERNEESRQLRRSKDGMLIANAYISPERVTIVPSSEVRVAQSTPPFQPFFINRIVKGYEVSDKKLVDEGKLEQGKALSYSIEESDGDISKITISNYRDKARLNEILSTASWALSKMLEKK